MITKKEQEVMVIRFDIPAGVGAVGTRVRDPELLKKRLDHIKALHARGVSMSQIARAYKISRQRVHQIIHNA